jgi:hypothetical protein
VLDMELMIESGDCDMETVNDLLKLYSVSEF